MKTIKTVQGDDVYVDDADYDMLKAVKWYIHRNDMRSYAVRSGNNRHFSMHRMIAGAGKGEIVDHIDGNGLNNCRSNLRICASRENARNRIKYRPTASRFKGVIRRKSGGWEAQICVDYQNIRLGVYESELHAAFMYDTAALLYHKEYALTNSKMFGVQYDLVAIINYNMMKTIRRAKTRGRRPTPLADVALDSPGIMSRMP